MNKANNLSKYKNFKQVHKVPNLQEDEDDSELQHIHLPLYESTSVSRCIKVYLDENIKQPSYYRNLVHAIENLSEDDVVHLSINSYGGQLDSAISIIGAMQRTEAHVHCSIDGMAASAASLIALAAPSLSIAPMASMMIHAATFGTFGTQSSVVSHASFVDKKVKDIMQEIYKDFLTQKELDEVFMGAEIWMNADEIFERLENRSAIQEKRYMKEQRELQKSLKSKKVAAKKVSSSEEAVVDNLE